MSKSRWLLIYPSLACGFLLLAVLSKFYRGPFWSEVNAYAGDLAIVACLYFCLSSICPKLPRCYKALIIAAIALVVEWFQSSGIPASWNLPAPFVWVLGSRYDALDFIFYALGILAALILDRPIKEKLLRVKHSS